MEHSAAITEDLGTITDESFDRMRVAEARLVDATRELGEIWDDAMVRMKEALADLLTIIQEPITIDVSGLRDFLHLLRAAPRVFQQLDEIAPGGELTIFRGTKIVGAELEAQELVVKRIQQMERLLELNQEIRDSAPYPLGISDEGKKAIEANNEDIQEIVDALETVTGLDIEIPFSLDTNTPKEQLDAFLKELLRSLYTESGFALSKSIQFKIDTGDLEGAIAEIKETFGTGLDDVEVEAKESAEDIMEAITNAVRDGVEELEDLFDKFNQKTAQLNRRLANDLAKIDRTLRDRISKINRDLANNIADEHRKAAEDRAKAERDYRENELKEEEKFQLKMKRLREDYLFSLEDALIARDAVQIIRLRRQYNKDRKQAKEDYDLGKKDRKKDHNQELADIKRQNKLRIEELRRDAEERRKEAQIQAETQRRERNIRYDQELEELDIFIGEKLQAIAEGLGDEYDLNVSFLEAMERQFRAKYAPGSEMYNYAMHLLELLELIRKANAAEVNANIYPNYNPQDIQGLGGSSTTPPEIPGLIYLGNGKWGWSDVGSYGEGGTLIARKPTLALFGEEGPEMVQFTPLGGGANLGGVGNLGSIPSVSPARDGGLRKDSLSMEFWLSEDLEARIVETTLDETADIFEGRIRSR
jgi:hypothetical protein